MRILYAINQNRLNGYIKDYVSSKMENVVEITGTQSTNADFIFTVVNNHEDVKTLQKKAIPEHTLIAIVDNDRIMFDSLELYPLCYIRLSNLDKDLEKCCSLMKTIYDKEEILLSFKIKNSVLQLKSSNIYYIESFSHYLTIYTKSGQYTVRDTLANVNKKVPQGQFVQVHRSYIINKKYIKKITSHEVTLVTMEDVPIGNKYKSFIKEMEF